MHCIGQREGQKFVNSLRHAKQPAILKKSMTRRAQLFFGHFAAFKKSLQRLRKSQIFRHFAASMLFSLYNMSFINMGVGKQSAFFWLPPVVTLTFLVLIKVPRLAPLVQ